MYYDQPDSLCVVECKKGSHWTIIGHLDVNSRLFDRTPAERLLLQGPLIKGLQLTLSSCFPAAIRHMNRLQGCCALM